jgi:hypothetical protein
MAFKMPNYNTYDTSTGYGNAKQWKKSFNQRMGMDEAQEIMRKQMTILFRFWV